MRELSGVCSLTIKLANHMKFGNPIVIALNLKDAGILNKSAAKLPEIPR